MLQGMQEGCILEIKMDDCAAKQCQCHSKGCYPLCRCSAMLDWQLGAALVCAEERTHGCCYNLSIPWLQAPVLARPAAMPAQHAQRQ